MKKIATFSVLLILFSLGFCYIFVMINVPANSVVRVEDFFGKQFFLENSGDYAKTFHQLHKNTHLLEVGKTFAFLNVNVIAPNRSEKVLVDDFHFQVLFPDQYIAAHDTSWVYGKIRAHAYVMLQKASAIIGNDYYSLEEEFAGYSYPDLFKHFLNSSDDSYLAGLHFTGVKISRIDYETGKSLDEASSFFQTCLTFIMVGNTMNNFGYQEELDSLCNGFSQEFINFLERKGGDESKKSNKV